MKNKRRKKLTYFFLQLLEDSYKAMSLSFYVTSKKKYFKNLYCSNHPQLFNSDGHKKLSVTVHNKKKKDYWKDFPMLRRRVIKLFKNTIKWYEFFIWFLLPTLTQTNGWKLEALFFRSRKKKQLVKGEIITMFSDWL